MKVVSVNVGLPRHVPYRDGSVRTAIYKQSVAGRVGVALHNIDGDGQADLSVHGGPDKAVYAYPSEHYAYWRETLGQTLEWGAFGENLTTSGLLEADVCIGDPYRIGSSLLVVTQPRQPCFKLAMKLDRGDMVTLFRKSGRSGFYLKVVDPGEVGPEDRIELVRKSGHGVTISDVNRLRRNPDQPQLLHRVLAVPELSESQRGHFENIQSKSVAG